MNCTARQQQIACMPKRKVIWKDKVVINGVRLRAVSHAFRFVISFVRPADIVFGGG